MFLIQILLPLTLDGTPIARARFAEVGQELTDRFGGLTAYTRAPAEGLWRTGGQTTADQVVVYEVMAGSLDRRWWGEYRRTLEDRFQQEEVVVRAQAMERL